MKKLSKLLAAAAFAAILFFTQKADAQNVPVNSLRLGIGAESGITTGAINGAPSAYVGGTASLQYGVSKNLALTLTSGYYNFIGNQSYKSMGLIPLKAGFKYFVSSGFYFSGEFGVAFELQNRNYYYGYPDGDPKRARLILSPGFGYAVKNWDFNLRYERFSGSNPFPAGNNNTYGLVGLRITRGFNL